VKKCAVPRPWKRLYFKPQDHNRLRLEKKRKEIAGVCWGPVIVVGCACSINGAAPTATRKLPRTPNCTARTSRKPTNIEMRRKQPYIHVRLIIIEVHLQPTKQPKYQRLVLVLLIRLATTRATRDQLRRRLYFCHPLD